MSSKWKTYVVRKGKPVPVCPDTGDAVPKDAGVYAVCYQGGVIYVGSTCSLYKRMLGHQFSRRRGGSVNTPWGTAKTRLTIKCRPARCFGEQAMAELRLLRRLRPRCNKKFK